jgi:hypothetical protein
MAMPKQQLPPVPPAGRSNKGPGNQERRTPDAAESEAAAKPAPGAAGRHENIAVNTTHQGHQQDR